MKILLASKSDTGRSKSVSGQRLVNLYAEPNPEGSKYPFTIYGTPGVKPWAGLSEDISSENTTPYSEVLGMQVMGDYLYAVVAVGDQTVVYRVSEDRIVTTIGAWDGHSGIVDLANNGTQMVCVTDGNTTYGGQEYRAFYWTETPATPFGPIGDSDLGTPSSVCFLDGYIIFGRLNSGQFTISSLYDATEIDALDFATSEELPDYLVRVTAFNGGLWLPNQRSMEHYANTGNTDFPYEQIPGAVSTSRGLAAKHSPAQEDNTLFFLGNDLVVYRMEGYTPKRVSTAAVESAIETYTNYSDAFGFIYTQAGHKFYVLTFPSHDATWVYDISTDLWHERRSEGTRWRANCHAFFAGKNLIGDFKRGMIYELDLETAHEEETSIVRIARGSVQWADGDRVHHDEVRLDLDAGTGIDYQLLNSQFLETYSIPNNYLVTTNTNNIGMRRNAWVAIDLDDGTVFRSRIFTAQILGGNVKIAPYNQLPSSGISANTSVRIYAASAPVPVGLNRTPVIAMRYSDDGGRTWSNERTTSIGIRGEFANRAIWRRNGTARERIYEWTLSDPVKNFAITGAYLKARKGAS